MKHAQIVIRAMENESPLCKRLIERLERKSRKRIDQHVLVFGTYLYETELFEIAMETIRLGVQRDSGEGRELGD
jgi:hypothetical protein